MATDSNRRFSGKAPATARTSTGFARFLAVVGTGEAGRWRHHGVLVEPEGNLPDFRRAFEMYSHNENTMFESINKLAKQSVRCLMD
ncbi:MAG: hypothetical protein IPN71_15605 [Fibrobacteres bacterium]|nr:hypothetical protein [Fibrobacterota bacterium]